jgi:hypothetical protein
LQLGLQALPYGDGFGIPVILALGIPVDRSGTPTAVDRRFDALNLPPGKAQRP